MDNKVHLAISILYDMELNNYKMTRSIHRLNYEISCLGQKQTFYEPTRDHAVFNGDWTGAVAAIGMILGAIICGASGCESTSSVFGSIEAGIGGLFGGGIGGAAFGALIGAAFDLSGQASRDQQYEEKYNEELRKYTRLVEQDEIRVRQELKQQAFLISERDTLIEKRTQSQLLLDRFYTKVGIDKTFRKLIPISKMYEITSLQITTRFTGENGLYDRVRRELREDAFHATLEDISQKLNIILNNQEHIYAELININNQCENLVAATKKSANIAANNNQLLNAAVKNTSIAAYNSERIAIEERYQSSIMTQDHYFK